MMDLISIVIPSYNSASTIARTLNSILNQDHQNFEVIIVDDGSTDKSLDVIMSYKDKRFKVHKMNHAGVAEARNFGTRQALSNIIVFLDSDDLLSISSITSRLVAFKKLEHDKSFAGVFCSAQLVLPNGKPMFLPLAGFRKKLLKWGDTFSCPFIPSQVMIKKSVLETSGGFDSSLSGLCEDHQLWLRILKAGFYFSYDNKSRIRYLQRPESAVHSRALEHYFAFTKVLTSLLENHVILSEEKYKRGVYSAALLAALNDQTSLEKIFPLIKGSSLSGIDIYRHFRTACLRLQSRSRLEWYKIKKLQYEKFKLLRPLFNSDRDLEKTWLAGDHGLSEMILNIKSIIRNLL